MKDKVFWSILGAILLGWVLLFFLFVWPKMDAYNEVTDTLSKSNRAIQKYARMAAEELPTEDLVEAQEKYLASWNKQNRSCRTVPQEPSRAFRRRSGGRPQLLVDTLPG